MVGPESYPTRVRVNVGLKDILPARENATSQRKDFLTHECACFPRLILRTSTSLVYAASRGDHGNMHVSGSGGWRDQSMIPSILQIRHAQTLRTGILTKQISGVLEKDFQKWCLR